MTKLAIIGTLVGILACSSVSSDTRPAESAAPRAAAGTGVTIPVVQRDSIAVDVLDVEYATVTQDQMVVNGLQLNLSQSEITTIVGPPLKVVAYYDSTVVDDTVTRLTYSSFEVQVYGRYGAQYITCFGADCTTASGIQHGDHRSRVEQTYGRGYWSADPVRPWLQYRSRESDCGITFTFEADTVTTIMLWCDWS